MLCGQTCHEWKHKTRARLQTPNLQCNTIFPSIPSSPPAVTRAPPCPHLYSSSSLPKWHWHQWPDRASSSSMRSSSSSLLHVHVCVLLNLKRAMYGSIGGSVLDHSVPYLGLTLVVLSILARSVRGLSNHQASNARVRGGAAWPGRMYCFTWIVISP
jgi:hypothetical protein